MSEEITLDEYKKAYREIKIEEERKSFTSHLIAYILINLMLIAMNIIYSPKAIWFIYPLFGWGIGITAHYIGATRWLDKQLENNEANAEYRARKNKMSRVG